LTLTQPPHPDDKAMFDRFASIDIGPGLLFEVDELGTGRREAIARGVASARTKMADVAKSMGEKVNGWMSLDPFGNRAFYDGDYMKRAASAMVGWGGNDRIEADYPMARTDVDGNPLDGNAKYQMKFETLPPVHAFWSVTMYDTSYDGTAVRGSRHLSFASADFPLSGARLRTGLLRVFGLL
jgi:hypothetical protein